MSPQCRDHFQNFEERVEAAEILLDYKKAEDNYDILVDLMDKEAGPGGERPQLVRRPSGGSLFGTTEIAQDFVMVDLKTPFAQQQAQAV